MSLRELSNITGASGDEARVRAYITEQIRDVVDTMWVDPMGNLIAQTGADTGGPHLMVAAHMDEVGLIVTHIETDGTLRFRTVGGIDARVLPSVIVHIGEQAVPGVIGTKPIHLKNKAERDKPVALDDLFIDIGARTESAAKQLVSPGDYAVFATLYDEMGDDRAIGKAFDDRVGCHLLVELLKQLEGRSPVRLTAAFTVQEEIGLRGAGVAAYTVQPDVALVLEGTTCADIPLSIPHGESTRLGHGPAITIADRSTIAHPSVVNVLTEAAAAHNIPFQWKRTTFGGTDAGSIHQTGPGIPTAIVSVPCRYIHTPVAMCSLQDVTHSLQLISAFVHSIPSWRNVP